MDVIETSLPGVLILQPRVFGDERGFFMETYNERTFAAIGIREPFVQDNHSRSARDVVRGLHYQVPNAQGKLLRCVAGSLFDVAVDIRRGSSMFGRWTSVELSAENRRMLWIPPGFAHGFCVTTPWGELVYKCTTLWEQADDRAIAWNDPDLGIEWPVKDAAVLSARDRSAPRLREATVLPDLPEADRP
jgi:dTDP-4-dehydrorhamnose 3,5-epimerase